MRAVKKFHVNAELEIFVHRGTIWLVTGEDRVKVKTSFLESILEGVEVDTTTLFCYGRGRRRGVLAAKIFPDMCLIFRSDVIDGESWQKQKDLNFVVTISRDEYPTIGALLEWLGGIS